MTNLTRAAAMSGITTLVECPCAMISSILIDHHQHQYEDKCPPSPFVCSTAHSLSKRWQLLNNDALTPKYIDYGMLAAVDPMRMNEVDPIAQSGYALGLFCVIGSPLGAPGTCPAPIEALKVPRIARTAADGGMRGSLFVRAETYTPKQLRLASPLRAENVSVRRLPELKIDHPIYARHRDWRYETS